MHWIYSININKELILQWIILKDTLVRRGEVFVEGPVEDVGYVRAEGVTCAGVHRVLCDLPVRHAGALKIPQVEYSQYILLFCEDDT